MIEQTFVIIKPDAINRRLVGSIIQRLERKNPRNLRIESRQKNFKWVRDMYPHIFERLQMGKWLECEYMDFANFMISTPLIGMTLEGNNAISVVRKMIGATDSREALPGTIRGDYGTYPVMFNCIHASDSYENVEREAKLFYES
ncbi:MAG: nucleoside-diphosphate kinase [Clostridia bacterium]|jgi:nucleoside-diphosphate kinase